MAQVEALAPIMNDRLPSTVDILTKLWVETFGPKGRDTNQIILQIGVGFRRIIRFSKAIEAKLGYEISPTAIMRLGTIQAIAATIETNIWPEITPLLLLKDGAEDQTLYLVAAGGGVALELSELAELIDFPGQIYGLQLPGLDAEVEPLSSIEDIAQFYVDAILSKNATGPFYIAGYSFGGLVGFEMVRILMRLNKSIGLFGLFDTTTFEKYWPLSEWLGFTIKHTFRRLAALKQMKPHEALLYLTTRSIAAGRFLKRRLNNQNATVSLHKSIYYVDGLEIEFQKVRDASIIAFESYQPSAQECDAVLFKSMLGDPHACDPVKIWKPLVRTLEVIIVPGTHTTMIRKPFAEILAASLSERLLAGKSLQFIGSYGTQSP